MSHVPTAGAVPAAEHTRAPRHDGEASRARLLRSGLQLFAQQGYAKTSTRELAEHAGVNVASISYYFGDKAGLYRAVFFEPLGSPQDDIARYSGAGAEPGAGAGRAVRRLPGAAEAGRHRAAVHEAALPRDARAHRAVGRGDRPRHQADARCAAGRAVPALRRRRRPTTSCSAWRCASPAWACTCMSATTSSSRSRRSSTTAPTRSTAGPTGW